MTIVDLSIRVFATDSAASEAAGDTGQFTIRRTGSNLFDASCFGDLSGAYCYNSLAPSALRYGAGGSLLYDFDPAGGSISSFSCATLGYCEAGYGLREVAVGRGDSGGAAFTTGFEIAGVASWGSGSSSLGAFNSIGGHACVAQYTANEFCMANYDFVKASTVPEPATLSLFGTGLFALALGLRRRNSK